MPEFGPLISVEDLNRRLEESDSRVLDCRFDLGNPKAGRESWLEAHIPGAVYADLDNDLSAPVTSESGRHPLPGPATASETFSRLGIGTDTNVVVYDAGPGAFAARAWWMLHWLGHQQVAVLDGGFAAWRAQGYSVESGEVTVEPSRFDGVPCRELVLTTEEVCASGASALMLVDAREAPRFAGSIEPIDAVAGHIPGALNRPFADSLDGEGLWKSPDELAALWQETLGERLGEPWAVMCGSGVTACHLAISAALAGLPRPRLYVGSWSEWICDPERPVEKGT